MGSEAILQQFSQHLINEGKVKTTIQSYITQQEDEQSQQLFQSLPPTHFDRNRVVSGTFNKLKPGKRSVQVCK